MATVERMESFGNGMPNHPAAEPRRPPLLKPAEPVPTTVLNFFPAFAPPKSGGEMRYWHLYDRLSRLGFDLQLVNPTYPFVEPETIEHNPLMREFRIPKTMTHHRFHQVMRRILRQGECSAPVVALATAWHHPEFIGQARQSIARSRMVIFDYPLPIDSFLSVKSPDRPFIVYNSYNVEKILLQRTMTGLQGQAVAAIIGRYERKLCRYADVIFACSHEDADSFVRLYGVDPTKIYIIPNGVDTVGIQPVRIDDEEATEAARRTLNLDPDQPVALFMGSQHPPNIEAGEFIIRSIAPKLPHVQFVIAGSVCGGITGSVPDNVRLQGRFEDDLKPALLQSASVAINPLFSGSGTNLKMLEFFAAGLPVVATPFGARGLLARDGEHLCLAEKDQFADRLNGVIRNPELRSALARESRRLACDRFNWDHIAKDAAEILHHKTHRRVLVLNDFPVTPVTFGGKVRIFHLYQPIAREANVTILTHNPDPQYARGVLAPGVEELKIPITATQRYMRKILARLVGVAADDLVAYLTVRRTKSMREAYLRERRHADAIILSHPFMVPLVRGDEKYPLLYDSHGVASLLKSRLYGKGFWGRWGLKHIFNCEREAIRRSLFIAGCSEEDVENFRRVFGDVEGMEQKLAVVPNGVDCAAHHPPSMEQRAAMKRQAGYADNPVAVFLASGHPPNVDAARFILSKVAPHHPKVQFLFIGSVCWAVKDEATAPNIHLLYEQEEDAKNRLLEMADIALNPLMAGSGTCLKVLDYMAAGSTVLATEIGARGISIENGISGIVCPLEETSAALGNLVSDLRACHEMGCKGSEIACDLYDWTIAARPLMEALRPVIGKMPTDRFEK